MSRQSTSYSIEMISLSEPDTVRLVDVEDRINEAAAQLGYNREQFLAREQVLTRELSNLREERTRLINGMARTYLREEAPEDWQFNASNKTFERKT